jgi:hypothetical protein
MLNSHLTMFNGLVWQVDPGVPDWDGQARAIRGIAEHDRKI